MGAVNNFNKAVCNLLLFLLSLSGYIAISVTIIIIISSSSVISVVLIRTFGLEFQRKSSGNA